MLSEFHSMDAAMFALDFGAGEAQSLKVLCVSPHSPSLLYACTSISFFMMSTRFVLSIYVAKICEA